MQSDLHPEFRVDGAARKRLAVAAVSWPIKLARTARRLRGALRVGNRLVCVCAALIDVAQVPFDFLSGVHIKASPVCVRGLGFCSGSRETPVV